MRLWRFARQPPWRKSTFSNVFVVDLSENIKVWTKNLNYINATGPLTVPIILILTFQCQYSLYLYNKCNKITRSYLYFVSTYSAASSSCAVWHPSQCEDRCCCLLNETPLPTTFSCLLLSQKEYCLRVGVINAKKCMYPEFFPLEQACI